MGGGEHSGRAVGALGELWEGLYIDKLPINRKAAVMLRFRTCNLAKRVRGVQKSHARNAADMEGVSAKITFLINLWENYFCTKGGQLI